MLGKKPEGISKKPKDRLFSFILWACAIYLLTPPAIYQIALCAIVVVISSLVAIKSYKMIKLASQKQTVVLKNFKQFVANTKSKQGRDYIVNTAKCYISNKTNKLSFNPKQVIAIPPSEKK